MIVEEGEAKKKQTYVRYFSKKPFSRSNHDETQYNKVNLYDEAYFGKMGRHGAMRWGHGGWGHGG